MKLKNILISGLGVLALTACNDFLDVEAPSKYTTDLVYGTKETANTALNGVYANMLSNNTFGRYLYSDAMLNSDVDFVANSNETSQSNTPRRFDLDAGSGIAKNLWNQLYATIESANMFISNCQTSPMMSNEDSLEVKQMMAEAGVLRAACYSELMWYFGDVPFTFTPTNESGSLNPDVKSRDEIADLLIADLQSNVKYLAENPVLGIEKISKDAGNAVIARIALQAGGYYLSHDAGDNKGYKMVRRDDYKKYYEIARDAAKEVVDGHRHSLSLDYKKVFVDECNFIVNSGDDAIWEIPFAKETSGQVGYYQGPTVSGEETGTLHTFGKTSGSVRTTAFYRFMFKPEDARRDYVCGLVYFGSDNKPALRADYAMHNNKWSKLWSSIGLGKTTEGNTGINFPYVRYADVLLMLAEAENELNDGPTELALQCLNTVCERAYRGSGYDYQAENAAAATKEAFLKAVLDERAKEFAGENLRWKDLVRNNKYGEVLYYTFLTYYSIAENMVGSAPNMDAVNDYWNWTITKNGTEKQFDFSADFPTDYYTCFVKNVTSLVSTYPNLKDHVGDMPLSTELKQIYVANFYGESAVKPTSAPNLYDFGTADLGDIAITEKDVTGLDKASTKYEWATSSLSWTDTNSGLPKAQILYSLFGYIRGNATSGRISIVTPNGDQIIEPLTQDVNALPAVRYLMPYPKEAIARSGGKYTQNYGY